MAGYHFPFSLLLYRLHKYASAIYINNDHKEKAVEFDERKQKVILKLKKLGVSKPLAVLFVENILIPFMHLKANFFVLYTDHSISSSFVVFICFSQW